jgi:hypothetical protein
MAYFDLHKVPLSESVAIIATIACLIIPPFWYLFQFEVAIFKLYSPITLALLSFSIGFPILALNLALLRLIPEAEAKTRIEEINRIFYISMYNLLIFYVPCLLTYFTHVSAKLALHIGTGTEAFYILLIGRALQLQRHIKQLGGKSDKELETSDSKQTGR